MQTRSDDGLRRQGPAARAIRGEIAEQLQRIRRRTVALVEPLPQPRIERQVRDFMSPLVWDLGHIADFERLWLVDAVEGRGEGRLQKRFDALETPRQQRHGLALPDKRDALETLERVRNDTLALLADANLAGADPLLRDGYVYRMVLQHEAQHQETMLQALDVPADDWGYAGLTASGDTRTEDDDTECDERPVDDEARVEIPGGSFPMGTTDRTRAYDNERSRHQVTTESFQIDRYPVSNRRWRRFIEDGGYRKPELWSAPGRAWLEESGAQEPQGWHRDDGQWRVRRFGRLQPLDEREPVQHVCFWEAEAFARWCGGCLPDEAQWEKAAAWSPAAAGASTSTFPWGERAPAELAPLVRLEGCPETADWGPPCLGERPAMASASGVEDLLGAVYQWTRSPFRPYPGFEAFPYDGYSEVFFGDTYRVLRGSSWAADALLWRNTYRNWDLPQRRQIFAGVRVVYPG